MLAGGSPLSKRLNPCRPVDAALDGTKRSEYTLGLFGLGRCGPPDMAAPREYVALLL